MTLMTFSVLKRMEVLKNESEQLRIILYIDKCLSKLVLKGLAKPHSRNRRKTQVPKRNKIKILSVLVGAGFLYGRRQKAIVAGIVVESRYLIGLDRELDMRQRFDYAEVDLC